MQVFISNHKSTEAAIRNLEIKDGQLGRKLEEKFEKQFGANTEVNPKKECNAIMSISNEWLEERKIERKEKDELCEKEEEIEERKSEVERKEKKKEKGILERKKRDN
ncbi:hypothetical protein VIGAN_05213200 [Vigna angularis var. angularis]|uniref:Uncharacterized protein n=1 Tax=Vigna angularis var. angularis TaxID=157739 RepID=A0A0S3S6Z1_PHAAN|nr:hypothetical protein VIGAN_05213200 [Vigna angularis var. angularis]